MNILDDVLYKEILEKEISIKELQMQLLRLPKGSIQVRKTSKEAYAYRKWREGDKVLSEYLGPLSSKKTLEKITQVNEYKAMLERLKKEEKALKELKKAYKLILLKTNLN